MQYFLVIIWWNLPYTCKEAGIICRDSSDWQQEKGIINSNGVQDFWITDYLHSWLSHQIKTEVSLSESIIQRKLKTSKNH